MHSFFVLHHQKFFKTQTSKQAVGNDILCTIFYTVDGPEGTINQWLKAVMRFFFLNDIYVQLLKPQTAMCICFHELFAFAFISLPDIFQLTSQQTRKTD